MPDYNGRVILFPKVGYTILMQKIVRTMAAGWPVFVIGWFIWSTRLFFGNQRHKEPNHFFHDILLSADAFLHSGDVRLTSSRRKICLAPSYAT